MFTVLCQDTEPVGHHYDASEKGACLAGNPLPAGREPLGWATPQSKPTMRCVIVLYK
jgi:hypothetical protein